MGPIGCPETSVHNYHSTLYNTPEERRSLLHRGGSLKSRMCVQSSETVLSQVSLIETELLFAIVVTLNEQKHNRSIS
jgi:hypothetical protein